MTTEAPGDRAVQADPSVDDGFKIGDLPLRARLTYAAHLFKAIARQHHKELRPLLAPHMPAEAVVIDVGGHAGQFAKLFAKLANHGRVYSFEPGGYARSILRRAVAANRLPHVEVIAAAVGDAPGRLVLAVPLKRNGVRRFGVSHIHHADSTATKLENTARESVPVVTLDTFATVRGLARIDFIKADIEGFEGRLLAGAADALARFRPVLLLELVDGMLARGGDNLVDVWARLAAAGYRAWTVAPGLSPQQPVDVPQDGEFLFLPDGRKPPR